MRHPSSGRLFGLVFGLSSLAFGVGCSPARPPETAVKIAPAPLGEKADFAVIEERYLRRLAASDVRLLARLERNPSEQELTDLGSRLTGGEREGGLIGQALDPFAFEARARETKLAFDELSAHGPALGKSFAEERALLADLHAAEAVRARREKDLTTYGADLLVAAAVVAHSAENADVTGARDSWLSERFGDVTDAMERKKTSIAHRRELADTLDPLERTLSPARFPRAYAALVKLRETVGEARMLSEKEPLPEPAPEVNLGDAKALVGETLSDAEVVKTLVMAERVLDREAKKALALLSEHEADTARTRAGKRLALRASCKNSGASSVMRSLAAPREREAGCLAVRALAEAKGPSELAEAWVLLHDRVAVAVWAASFHGEHTSLDVARGRAGLLGLAEDYVKSALLRRVAIRSADALGAGLVASLVTSGEGADASRAKKLVAFGDASLVQLRARVGP